MSATLEEQFDRMRLAFIEEAIRVVDEIMVADHNPRRAQIVAGCRRNLERTDFTDAIIWALAKSTTDAEAIAIWSESVGRHIRRSIADLRPS